MIYRKQAQETLDIIVNSLKDEFQIHSYDDIDYGMYSIACSKCYDVIVSATSNSEIYSTGDFVPASSRETYRTYYNTHSIYSEDDIKKLIENIKRHFKIFH